MKKQTILHVGLHKTGTSYLQASVFPLFHSYTLLTRPYTQHNFAFNKLQFADDSLYSKKEMEEELGQFGDSNLIISDESFCGKPYVFSFINRSMIAKRFKELFPDAKLILTIRGQQDILLSHYNNWVKGPTRGDRPIERFLWYPYGKNFTYDLQEKTALDRSPLNTLYFNNNKVCLHLDGFLYYELIKTFKDLFDDVNVLLFEDIKTDPQGVLDQIEGILGEKIDREILNTNKQVNPRLGNRGLQTRVFRNRIWNRTGSRFLARIAGKLYGIIARDHSGVDKEKVRELVGDYYHENNRRIIETWPDIGLQRYPKAYGVGQGAPKFKYRSMASASSL